MDLYDQLKAEQIPLWNDYLTQLHEIFYPTQPVVPSDIPIDNLAAAASLLHAFHLALFFTVSAHSACQ